MTFYHSILTRILGVWYLDMVLFRDTRLRLCLKLFKQMHLA